MRISSESAMFTTILASILVLPSATYGFLPVSSLAPGLLLVLIFIMLYTNSAYLKKALCDKCILFFMYLALLNLFVTGLWRGVDPLSFISLLAFWFLLLSAKQSQEFLSRVKNIEPPIRIVSVLGLFLLTLSLVSDYEIGKYFYGRTKSIFPFLEPSHFALAFGPFFIAHIRLMRSNSRRASFLFTILALSVLVNSLVLVLYVFLAMLMFVNLRSSTIIPFAIMSLLIFFAITKIDYYKERLKISESSSNLSVLVYIQGVQDSIYSITSTFGLGLGFQRLGSQEASPVSREIMAVTGADSINDVNNRKDGSFLAAKIVSEFGILGLLILTYYLILFKRALFQLRSRDFVLNSSRVDLLCSVFIFSFFIELFVRGVGYFSPSFYFFIVALFLLRKRDKKILAGRASSFSDMKL